MAQFDPLGKGKKAKTGSKKIGNPRPNKTAFEKQMDTLYIIMSAVIVVLFVGFLTLLVGAFYEVSHNFNDSTNSKIELIKEVNQLRQDVKDLRPTLMPSQIPTLSGER